MEALLAIVAVVIIAAVIFVKIVSGEPSTPTRPSKTSVEPQSDNPFSIHRQWLEERWRAAENARLAGNYATFPQWYFEAATERQLARLEREGIKSLTLTKGQASDLIGLTEPADDSDLEVLKFFDVACTRMNQTVARAKVHELWQQPGNTERWDSRPATPEQKRSIRFFGGTVPKGLIATHAQKMLYELQEANPTKVEDLDNLTAIFDEFNDADFREILGIKKPSRAVVQEAIDALLAAGQSLEELAMNTDLVGDKVLELHPELERDV